MRLLNAIKKIRQISIIKTIRFNYHYFGWGGLIHPYVLLTGNVRLLNLAGKVLIKNPSLACIKLGFHQVGIIDSKTDRLLWDNSGTIVFDQNANIGSGSKIACSGELDFGNGFIITANSSIVCRKKIVFGSGCLVSWDCLFMDTDFHKIYSLDSQNSELLNVDRPIIIGNDVWVGCRTTVLKGTIINDNNIVSAHTCLHGNYNCTNSVIHEKGVIKENVRWQN